MLFLLNKDSIFLKSILLTFVYIGFLILFSSCTKNAKPTSENLGFRYHIPVTPQTYDPILQKGMSSWFLLNHLYRPLVSINENDELYFNAAKECIWSNQNTYTCYLKPELKFENEQPIMARHYKYSFELAFEQITESSGLFLNLKNQDPKQDIIVIDDLTLQFVFKEYSPQDVYLLAKTEFSPRLEKRFYTQPKDIISSGPYKVKSHKKNQYLQLTSNDINNEILKTQSRPNVTVYFIEDEGTAIRMYESKHLDFIKNVPRTFFSKYKDQLHFQTMMRMDGIGFAGEITKDENLRKALIYALDYKELQNIYQSKGKPGCPALPSHFYKNNHCYDFDLKKAQEYYKKVSSELKNKIWKLSYSEVGGNDIKKGMEWMSYQWKKHLDLDVRIDPLESGQFYQKIRNKNFDIIRKGLPLSSPSCYEALDSFTKQSVNNFIGLNSTKLDQVVARLKTTPYEEKSESIKLCDEGLEQLKTTHLFIPLGEMYFAFLSNTDYQDWSINSFNMLNLEHLKLNLNEK